MFVENLKTLLLRLREDTRGAVVVETMIALPLLFWVTMASFEFYEVHRYKAVREKATFTIADMISREQCEITQNYLDMAHLVFNDMASDRGSTQIRFSVIEYDATADEYAVHWSHMRGEGDLPELSTDDVKDAHDVLPILSDGQQIILVDTFSTYAPYFKVGMGDSIDMQTRIFVTPRFIPKIDYKTQLEPGDCE